MRRKLAVLGLVVLVAGIAGAVLIRDTHPVLIRMPFGLNQETGDHNFVLFNPFRDRSPERAAAAYLEGMRRGDCADAGKISSNPHLPDGLTCDQLQSEYGDERSLFVQRLRDRKDSQGDVVLYYSDSGASVVGNWVAVQRSGDGWRVVGFNKLW